MAPAAVPAALLPPPGCGAVECLAGLSSTRHAWALEPRVHRSPGAVFSAVAAMHERVAWAHAAMPIHVSSEAGLPYPEGGERQLITTAPLRSTAPWLKPLSHAHRAFGGDAARVLPGITLNARHAARCHHHIAGRALPASRQLLRRPPLSTSQSARPRPAACCVSACRSCGGGCDGDRSGRRRLILRARAFGTGPSTPFPHAA